MPVNYSIFIWPFKAQRKTLFRNPTKEDKKRHEENMAILREFVCLWLLVVTSALQDCNSVFSSFESFTGKCNNKWNHLKPLIKRKEDYVMILLECF